MNARVVRPGAESVSSQGIGVEHLRVDERVHVPAPQERQAQAVQADRLAGVARPVNERHAVDRPAADAELARSTSGKMLGTALTFLQRPRAPAGSSSTGRDLRERLRVRPAADLLGARSAGPGSATLRVRAIRACPGRGRSSRSGRPPRPSTSRARRASSRSRSSRSRRSRRARRSPRRRCSPRPSRRTCGPWRTPPTRRRRRPLERVVAVAGQLRVEEREAVADSREVVGLVLAEVLPLVAVRHLHGEAGHGRLNPCLARVRALRGRRC